MDKTLVILLLGLANFYTVAALVVSIQGPTGPRMLKPGQSQSLICHFDMGLQVILDYKIHWVHMPSTPSAGEVILSEQQTLQPDIAQDHFAVDLKYEGDHTNVTITLKNAVSNMDGKFICRATAVQGGEVIEKEVTVIVPSDVSEVKLDFDGEEVSDVNGVAVQREEGEFSVSCRTKGFHPPGSLQLFLDDAPLEAAAEVSLDAEGSNAAGAQRSKASVKVPSLALSASDTGKTLRCVARADFEGAMEKVASVPLEIIALEPEISCDKNASGSPGDLYVKLTCHVNHERVDVDSYRFEIGDTGDYVVPNERSEGTFDTVLVQKESDTVDHVTLVIYEAAAWHFDTYYYLDVFLKNDQKFRMKAKLMRRDTTGGASKPVAYALCLLLSVLVWSL